MEMISTCSQRCIFHAQIFDKISIYNETRSRNYFRGHLPIAKGHKIVCEAAIRWSFVCRQIESQFLDISLLSAWEQTHQKLLVRNAYD